MYMYLCVHTHTHTHTHAHTHTHTLTLASQVVLVVKNPPANAGDLRYPGGGRGNPWQYSCLKNLHGQRSVVGYGPKGCKELDTTEVTEHAHAHTHTNVPTQPGVWRLVDWDSKDWRKRA